MRLIILLLISFVANAQLPITKISNSPANGKVRGIEIVFININPANQTITVGTKRHYYNLDLTKPDSIGSEINGSEYQIFESSITATNEAKCNPANGLRAYQIQINDSTVVWQDFAGNVVSQPQGFYDHFAPMLIQPVSIFGVVRELILAEDKIYKRWNN